MKILMISVTAGQGHHASAAAISEALEAKGARVLTLDVFKGINPVLYSVVDKGYLLTTKHTPEQFGRMYRNMNNDNLVQRSVVSFLTSEMVADKLYEPITNFNPDVIVSTHPFASKMIDELVQQKFIHARHIGIITDYTVHPLWDEVKYIDNIVVCSEWMKFRAIQKGIKPEKLLPFGIPVRSKFSEIIPQEKAREMLGLHKNKRTVLFMSGSMGFGNMSETVRKVARMKLDLQMAVICGNNEKMQSRLEADSFLRDNIIVKGFVDNVNVYMDACDVVVTKPGGLTVSEALVKHRPLILTNPIPGVEDENADYLVNYGLAMRATRNMPVAEIVNNLFTYPELMERVQTSINNFACTNATKMLSDFIWEMR